MAKDDISREVEQVNLILERIRMFVNDRLGTKEITSLIGKVIHMRESRESEEAIKSYISKTAGIEKGNPVIDSILAEIVEKPFQNNYLPFQNSLFEKMKKDLEKEF